MKAKSGFLSRLVKREDGLVTVEWVALAAAMVVGAVAIAYLVMHNLEGPAKTIGNTIGGVSNQVPPPFTPAP
jgi:Flp pilus assembly pilin Flp